MKELQPLNQNVLLDINPSKEEQKTKSGLIIPDTAKEKPQMARVIALGTIDNPAIAPGDMVLFKKYSGTEVEFEANKYLFIPYSDLLAKVVETESID